MIQLGQLCKLACKLAWQPLQVGLCIAFASLFGL